MKWKVETEVAVGGSCRVLLNGSVLWTFVTEREAQDLADRLEAILYVAERKAAKGEQ